MGTKNNPAPNDCYHKAAPDEPMFVLLARDPHAPALVEAWAVARARMMHHGQAPDTDQSKVDEAFACAKQMREWKEKQ